MENRLILVFPLISDIISVYESLRRDGQSREEAVKTVLAEFAGEAPDTEDDALTWIGLAMAMAKNKELTADVLDRSNERFDIAVSVFPDVRALLGSEKRRLQDPLCSGPEKKYRKINRFRPDWKAGDTFIQQMNGKIPRRFGMEKWYSVIRKSGEFRDRDGYWVQLVYLTVCEPDRIPRTTGDIDALGYIPIYPWQRQGKWEFQAGIRVGSRRQLSGFEFAFVGNYADALPPAQEYPPSHDTYHQFFPKHPAEEYPESIAMTACPNFIKPGRLH